VQQYRSTLNGLNSTVNRPSHQFLNGLRADVTITAPGNLLIGTTANPGQEKLVVNGAAKIGNPYGTITNGATTPVPNGGAGTMVFSGTNFFGWNGTSWKQLDN
jgi:hypothetical protein